LTAKNDRDRIDQARMAMREDRFAAAEQFARDALAAAPDDVDALEILFQCQRRFGDGAGAERTLRRAMASAPRAFWPRSNLARLLLGMGRAGEAKQVLLDAMAADSNNADARAMLASLDPGGARPVRPDY
jgi:predicted Zn-dependent protease